MITKPVHDHMLMWSLDVTVSFNETTFTAYENNRLAKPVLVLSNTVSYNITVAVSTFDVNATSELRNIHYYVSMCIIL